MLQFSYGVCCVFNIPFSTGVSSINSDYTFHISHTAMVE